MALLVALAGCVATKSPTTSCGRAQKKKGDFAAENELGYRYAYGLVAEVYKREGFRWYLKSAKQGDLLAQWNVASAYKYGRGMKTNFVVAAEWFQKAAEEGVEEAKEHLSDSTP